MPRAIARVLDSFASLWTSIILLTLIVLYAAVGSAVPIFRQYFELSEGAYFSHPAFGILVGLLVLTVVIATWRRIRFNLVNAGAITVHTGVLLLAGGSFLYFGNKIEGDVKLNVPRVTVYAKARLQRGSVDSAAIGTIFAVQGRTWQTNMPMAGGRYSAEVIAVKHNGMTTAQEVTLRVTSGNPPSERTVTLGQSDQQEAAVDFDDNVIFALRPATQTDRFYDNEVMALNVGAAGAKVSFPLQGLPTYAERFIPGGPEVLDETGAIVTGSRTEPIAFVDHWRLPIPIPTQDVPDSIDWPVRMTVDGFLPYAEFRTEPTDGGNTFNPVATIDMKLGEASQRASLFANVPEYSFDGVPGRATYEFLWLKDGKLPPELTRSLGGRHILNVEVKDSHIERKYEIREGQQFAIEGTPYKLKIDRLLPDWPLMTPGFENARSPVAQVSVSGNGKQFQRTVIQRYPALSQDVDDKGVRHRDGPYDANLVLTYVDCSAHHFLIAAGKDLAPLVVHAAPGGQRDVHTLQVGQPFNAAPKVGMTLVSLIEKPQLEGRPVVTNDIHRQRNAGRQMSLVRVRIESTQTDWKRYVWVPFTQYDEPDLRHPVQLNVPGLGPVELIYGRMERKLPGPITVEQLHVNFNPGRTNVRDWHSFIRFEDPDSGKLRAAEVYTNHTASVGGWTYYQATAANDHESWTGIGVGNRQGIMPMTLGCILITGGMLYAFYVKPVLKQRLKAKFAAQAQAAAAAKQPRAAGSLVVTPLWWLLAALLALSPLTAQAETTKPDPAALDSLREMQPKLKLDAFRLLVVQHGGRYQTVEAWARDVVKSIHGSREIDGIDPVVVALELIFNQTVHNDENIIYVKELGLRSDISAHLRNDDELRRIRTTGLVSYNFLKKRPAVLGVLADMETKVTMQRSVNRVKDSLFYYEHAADTFDVVPDPSDNATARWHSIEDLVGNAELPAFAGQNLPRVPEISRDSARNLLTNYMALSHAWQARDADTVNKQADILAAALPALAPKGVYLSQSQRQVEAFYTRMNAFTWGWGVYIFGLAISIWAVVTGWRDARRIAMGVFLVAFLLHGLGIALRWYILGRIPVANMFEAVISSAWVGAMLALGLELRIIRAWQVVYLLPMCVAVVLQQRYAGTALHGWWVVLAVLATIGLVADMLFVGVKRRGSTDTRIKPGIYILAACFLGFISLALGEYAVGSEITTIMGILDDVLLRIHTVLIITSYAIVTLAYGVAMCYLVVRAAKFRSGVARAALGAQLGLAIVLTLLLREQLMPLLDKIMFHFWPAFAANFGRDPGTVIVVPVFIVAGCVGGFLAFILPHMFAGRSDMLLGPATGLISASAGAGSGAAAGARIPSRTDRAALDSPLLGGLDLSQMTLMNMANIGLFAGTILGAVWADYSWGRPWGWDPKEVFALNTWLIYAILIHVRFLARDKGLWSAVVACIGFAMMMFNWWAVNFYIVGLHSYA